MDIYTFDTPRIAYINGLLQLPSLITPGIRATIIKVEPLGTWLRLHLGTPWGPYPIAYLPR